MSLDFDVLIVGSGPAGLSAANTLARQLHSAGVFDSGAYRNDGTKHFHALPTWDHEDPGKYRKQARKKILDNYQTIRFFDAEIKSLKEVCPAGGFEAMDSDGQTWRSEKVILASGVEDQYPDIPGYRECWPTSIFHCLVCHGYEERHAASSGVLAIDDLANVLPTLHFARMASQITPAKVTIYTHGNEELATQLKLGMGNATHIAVDTRKIVRLDKAPNTAGLTLHFDDGSITNEGFLGHKPRTRLRGDLWKQLGAESGPTGVLLTTPPFAQTTVQGIFAAGDVASPMMVASQALYGGSLAAAGVMAQLQAERLGQQGIV